MANRFSDIEYHEMVRVYYDEANESVRETVRIYGQSSVESLRRRGVENPTVPSRSTVSRAVNNWFEFRQFQVPPGFHARGGALAMDVELEEGIVEYFERNPRNSTREAARQFGVSHVSVWNVLRENGLHPFHYQKVQALYEQDGPGRLEFSNWLLQNRHQNILWTDEAMFTRVGLYNVHNEHWWTYRNPHKIKQHSHQIRFSVNCWAGILNNHVIGPHFIEGHLTGGTYLEMLQNVIPDLLDDIPLSYIDQQDQMYYQHDGAPAHYQQAVRQHLTTEFGERWIGRAGPVPWPARSPDLTPLDFYLWGEVKRLVYTEEASSVDDLKQRIIRAFEIVKLKTLNMNIQRELIKRAHACISRNGRHFEQFL
ncbi:hypothetical protein O0L34_g10090 [Tuta absoluta]|nr:hypothetical protein O0L34_g10090 [Tuta absoluta]